MPYRQSTDTYIGKRKDAISSVLFCVCSSHSVRKYTGITDEPLLCCCLIRKNARITDELLLFDLLVRKQAGITDGQIAKATKSVMSRLHVPRGTEIADILWKNSHEVQVSNYGTTSWLLSCLSLFLPYRCSKAGWRGNRGLRLRRYRRPI